MIGPLWVGASSFCVQANVKLEAVAAGEELLMSVSEALRVRLEYEDISAYIVNSYPGLVRLVHPPCRDEAASLFGPATDLGDLEIRSFLNDYLLVLEEKTNHICTLTFNAITSGHPPDFSKATQAHVL